jgi:4a-hydroxytetrahydrobiopterin dehydratase
MGTDTIHCAATPIRVIRTGRGSTLEIAMEKMSESEIAAALMKQPEWSETGEAIQRTYQFKDFAESMRFVNRVAEAAESAQHHPDILIRWNKVTLTLSTHDASGITHKDFALAAKCDGFAGQGGQGGKKK